LRAAAWRDILLHEGGLDITMTTDERTILFAGGGSGGHLTPGLAIAEALADRVSTVRTVFACSTRPIDARMLSDAGATMHPINARPPSAHPRRFLAFIRAHRAAVREARAMCIAERASLVVSLGGFVSAAVVAGAVRERVRTLLLNLDDPPGRANRWIARRCDDVWSAVPVTRPAAFATSIVGMPVRRDAIADVDQATCRRRLDLNPDVRTLLITGASQGAASLNAFAIAFARDHADALVDWQILHLAGPTNHEAVRSAYAELHLRHPPVVIDLLRMMKHAWGAADACISRAGASSVAEVTLNAVPTIFFPYPYHADQHQARNCDPLTRERAAICVTDFIDAERNLAAHADTLERLLFDHDYRTSMRDRLRELAAATPAAEQIAGRLLELLPSG